MYFGREALHSHSVEVHFMFMKNNLDKHRVIRPVKNLKKNQNYLLFTNKQG